MIHYGNILVSSNDPDTPLDTVTAELDILDPGEINVIESEIIDTLVAGTTGTFDINIENTGLADLNWSDNITVTFTKANYADYTLEANQDRITDDVWLTRQDYRSLYLKVGFFV